MWFTEEAGSKPDMASKQKRSIIGLTGIFGSGKSSVAAILKERGALVIDCDALVREIYKKYHPLQKKIARSLKLKKAKPADIAAVVFQNRKKRRQLERLVHPYVFKRIQRILKRSHANVIVIEMPLLLETGYEKKVDHVMVVTAPKRLIRQRLKRKGLTAQTMTARWRAQWPVRRKMKHADFIIHNAGNSQALRQQVTKWWRDFIDQS
ncbi:MAG: dephospho-CoA kinase [Candidatus Omnitrophica bacterium CG11_big_fil_rev_8_21_14_0_20_45_26]|uniref:Dephospho-CoA kinase n=1 Tax=Candidatus Abzuiibacterium crystallinum TaxID=1974748 RepID=A0A2H0LMH6_9BACT|nr:MAG: dephospho-CoA kinase [Candidatus Omnitrophica bacterium CG11_big_fil_rev_8_21_14_0_20_45_26]PIW63716.1 MAG: dephospho-CoA kinase [Candidatus Omnitrophica bacterium CG12_big_fil_rev_8_21_14_0_65_45_16]